MKLENSASELNYADAHLLTQTLGGRGLGGNL